MSKLVRKLDTTMVWNLSHLGMKLGFNLPVGSHGHEVMQRWVYFDSVVVEVRSTEPLGSMQVKLRFRHQLTDEVHKLIDERLSILNEDKDFYQSDNFASFGETRTWTDRTDDYHVATIFFRRKPGHDLCYTAMEFLIEVLRALRREIEIPQLPIPDVTQKTLVLLGDTFIPYGEYLARHFNCYPINNS